MTPTTTMRKTRAVRISKRPSKCLTPSATDKAKATTTATTNRIPIRSCPFKKYTWNLTPSWSKWERSFTSKKVGACCCSRSSNGTKTTSDRSTITKCSTTCTLSANERGCLHQNSANQNLETVRSVSANRWLSCATFVGTVTAPSAGSTTSKAVFHPATPSCVACGKTVTCRS